MTEPCHSIAFRDVRERVSSCALLRELSAAIDSIPGTGRDDLEDRLTSALLRAGELECAAADLELPGITQRSLETISTLLAKALIEPQRFAHMAASARSLLSHIELPEFVDISPPEGFCFYSLHPLDYCSALAEVEFPADQPIVVIGIRSIGSTLSAVVEAALQQRFGVRGQVRRMTVRPSGHPYDRGCEFSPQQSGIISRDCDFVVVDEGPGLSGSSFLSVGEGLIGLGVAAERITFICSRAVDPNTLVAPNASERWRRFRTVVAAPTRSAPNTAAIALHGGAWRERAFANRGLWPGAWTQLSARQYRSPQGDKFYKFEGLGRYGDAVRARTAALARAGFTVAPEAAGNGFTAYPWVNGRLLQTVDISPRILERMAEYLAFRSRAFPVARNQVNTELLERMTRFNSEHALGTSLPDNFNLPVLHPVIADARMMPYEWVSPEHGGTALKLDCGQHGDNHFFPGPVDIAWDLAGAVVEWQMDDAAERCFLARYRELTADDASGRLPQYMLAYAAFQSGYARMAASAMRAADNEETTRLLRDEHRYSEVMRATWQRWRKCAEESRNRTQPRPRQQQPALRL